MRIVCTCALQLTFLSQIYNWLRQQQHQQPNGVLANNVDLKNVALAGHSRGGKLAALQYANGVQFYSPHSKSMCAALQTRDLVIKETSPDPE